ncbi:hypothetical protein SLE2022_055200 [Rubroshorea leprosula]
MDRLISLEPSNLVAIRIDPGVKPQPGIIPPLVTLTVEIVYHLPPGSMLPDKFSHCDDSFLLHSVLVPGAAIKDPSSTFDTVPNEWFMTRKKQVFIDSGKKVMFVGSSLFAHLVIDGGMDEIRESRPDIVQLLLELEVDIELQSRSGSTPLEAAAAGLGDEQTVNLLLQKGANKEIRNNLGKTAYDVGTEYGYARLFDALKFRDNFCVAARKGETRTLQRLIEKGTDEEGYKALHCAVVAGQAEVVELLVKKGADVEARTEKGVTPLQIAESLHYAGISRILVHGGGGQDGGDEERTGRATVLRGSFDTSFMAPVAVL